MGWLDLLILLFALAYVSMGYRNGFVKTLGGFLGTFVSAYLAGHTFQYVAGFLSFLAPNNQNVVSLLVFIVMFVMINKVVSFVFGLLESILGVLTHLPFIHSFNKMGGAILGLLEGAFSISMFLYIAMQFPIGETATTWLLNSEVAKSFLVVAKVLVPLLPESLQLVL